MLVLDQAVWIEIIRITPSLLWFLLVCGLILRLYEPLRQQVLPHLTALKFGNLDVELSRFGYFMERVIAIADKYPQWQVEVSAEAKQQLSQRLRRNWEVLQGSRVLLFDDRPDTLINEMRMLQQLGMEVEVVTLSSEAHARLQTSHFDVLISDIARPVGQPNGIATLQTLHAHFPALPAIFYIGNFNAKDGVPLGAFGITNRPDELVHLILDILERKRS